MPMPRHASSNSVARRPRPRAAANSEARSSRSDCRRSLDGPRRNRGDSRRPRTRARAGRAASRRGTGARPRRGTGCRRGRRRAAGTADRPGPAVEEGDAIRSMRSSGSRTSSGTRAPIGPSKFPLISLRPRARMVTRARGTNHGLCKSADAHVAAVQDGQLVEALGDLVGCIGAQGVEEPAPPASTSSVMTTPWRVTGSTSA